MLNNISQEHQHIGFYFSCSFINVHSLPYHIYTTFSPFMTIFFHHVFLFSMIQSLPQFLCLTSFFSFKSNILLTLKEFGTMWTTTRLLLTSLNSSQTLPMYLTAVVLALNNISAPFLWCPQSLMGRSQRFYHHFISTFRPVVVSIVFIYCKNKFIRCWVRAGYKDEYLEHSLCWFSGRSEFSRNHALISHR